MGAASTLVNRSARAVLSVDREHYSLISVAPLYQWQARLGSCLTWDHRSMSKTPIAGPCTEGRTLGRDWSIANVAKLLRSNAGRGAWDSAGTGGSLAEVNQYYIRKVSAKHLPTSVSLIFMRLASEGGLLVCVSMLRECRWLSSVECGDRREVVVGVVW